MNEAPETCKNLKNRSYQARLTVIHHIQHH